VRLVLVDREVPIRQRDSRIDRLQRLLECQREPDVLRAARRGASSRRRRAREEDETRERRVRATRGSRARQAAAVSGRWRRAPVDGRRSSASCEAEEK
jgi:hypothetical protein